MKNFTIKSLFMCVCALAFFTLASCTKTSEFDTALPDTETRAPIPSDSIWLEFYDLPEPHIYPSQRITFRILSTGIHSYTRDDFNIRVFDPETRKTLAVSYDEQHYRYHFFTGTCRQYVLEISLVNDPSVKTGRLFVVERGIYLKLVETERWFYQNDETNGEIYLGDQVVQFYTDDSCTERIMSLPKPMQIRVLLVKRAVELFSPTVAHLYRDEKVLIQEGSSEGCPRRLITTHQTLPSGEHFDDYYEVEFLRTY